MRSGSVVEVTGSVVKKEGSKPPRCVLVCGARRTGTSLVAAILSADESTPPFPGEAQLIPRWLETYRWARDHFAFRSRPFFGDEHVLCEHYRSMMRSFHWMSW